jgi:UDP-N-acetylmuramyl tripeptide synthase
LTANGIPYINNRYGGNIVEGILTAIIKQTSFGGRCKKNLAVFEIDERSTPRIFKFMPPDYLVCTNLSQDSYKRNAHVEFIYNIIEKALPEKTKLILNGDDLLSSRLKTADTNVYYGIEPREDEPQTFNIINDMRVCPYCNSQIEYSLLRYNQIGRGECPKCGFKNPECDFKVTNITENLTVQIHDVEETYKIVNPNLINIYNMTAVIATLRTYGLTEKQLANAFQNMQITKTRYGEEQIGNVKIVKQLSKGGNPVAASANLDIIRKTPGKKAVVLFLQDSYDNDNIDFLAFTYASDFEFLNQEDVTQIIIGGSRCYDYKLRLLIAGVPEDKIYTCEREQVVGDSLTVKGNDIIFIVHDIITHDANVKILVNKIKEKMGNA